MTRYLLFRLISIYLICAFSNYGKAQLIFKEDFDYPIGSDILSQSWVVHNGAGTIKDSILITSGLTFNNFDGSGIGGAASVTGAFYDQHKTFTPQTSGKVYVAFMINAGPGTVDSYFLHLGPSIIGTNYFTRVWINASGTGIGLGDTKPAEYISIETGKTYLVVVKYDFSSMLNYIYIFSEMPISEPETAQITFREIRGPAGNPPSDMGSIALRQSQSLSIAHHQVIVDGIRIAKSWDELFKPTIIYENFVMPLPDTGWYLSQNFGSYNSSWSGYHLGEDYVARDKAELPVYSIYDGTVKHVATHSGYGYVVIIEHLLNDNTKICSVYGHLRSKDIIKPETTVSKGQRIGYLSAKYSENGGYNFSHLHFGIRKEGYSTALDSDMKWRYRGYGPKNVVDLWYDGSEYIETHKTTEIILSKPVSEAIKLKNDDITFSWTPVNFASKYEIWIDNNETFGSPEVGYNNGQSDNWLHRGIVYSNFFVLSENLMDLLPQNSYYWKVRALDTFDQPVSDWTNRYMITILDSKPEPPKQLFPSNTPYMSKSDILFEWTEVPLASFYEIWIDNNSGFGSPEVGFNNEQSENWVNNGIVEASSFTLTNTMQYRLAQTIYYWKVRALDLEYNPITEFSTRSEFTLLDQPPSPPLLQTPSYNSIIKKGNDITFSWLAVEQAVYYELWIDNNSGFGSPELGFNNGLSPNWIGDGIVNTTNFTLTSQAQVELPQNLYYWAVRALNADKIPITLWPLSINKFILLEQQEILSPPILLSPNDVSMHTTRNTLTFSWTKVKDAVYYEIWIDNNYEFTDPEVGYRTNLNPFWINNGIVSTNQFTLNKTSLFNIAHLQSMYWKVRALNSAKAPVTEWSENIGNFFLSWGFFVDDNNICYAFRNNTDGPHEMEVINYNIPPFEKYKGNIVLSPAINVDGINVPVKAIGDTAFSNCNDLNHIEIPSFIKTIGIKAFMNCTGLTSLNIPASLTSLGAYAFAFCSNIKNDISIPSALISIGHGAFMGSGNRFVVESNNSAYSSQDGVLFNKTVNTLIQCPANKTAGTYSIPVTVEWINDDAFAFCNQITEIKIPSSVSSIGKTSFIHCSALETVNIPSSVTEINNYAFAFCQKLKSIVVDSDIPIDLSAKNGVFYGVDKTTCTLYVPTASIELYKASSQWGDFQNIIGTNTAEQQLLKEKIQLSQNIIDAYFSMYGFEGTLKIRILDTKGQCLHSLQVTENERIEINNLAQGVYFVVFNTKGGVIVKKLIKK